MTHAWLVYFFAEKTNEHLGSIICEYVYLLELPMSWVSGIRMQPQRYVHQAELRKRVDGVE